MNIISKYRLARMGMAAAILGLAACTTGAPYMPADEKGKFAADGSEVVPPVTFITPELVKAQKVLREQQTGQDIRRLLGTPAPYAIGPGDILAIVVWGHPELATAVMTMQAPPPTAAELPNSPAAPPAGFVVDHEGLLQFPYAGVIKVAGLTEEQARNLLTSKLAVYINKPNVTLRVQAFRSKRIYIDGEVKSPGLQAINDIPMTLVEGLNRAGGVTPTADQSQMIIIRDGVTYRINLLQLVQRGIDPSSIMLANGDVVRVLSRDESKVFVAGEVTAPKSLTMHNGRLTLNEALGESGGINPLSGDASQVYIVRRSEKNSTVYRLDAHSPGALAMAEGFELSPKDLVYVAPTGLANWHRTISQLIPGALPAAVSAGR